MTRALVIVGCGGFGREVWAIVQALRADGQTWEVEGFVDDSPSANDLLRVCALGSSVIGSVAELAARSFPYSAALAVGSPPARQRLQRILKSSPIEYPQLIHPDSTLASSIDLGEGVVIAPGARLSTNLKVGAHVHIDQNVTIGHDTVIGDFARLNPQACVSGSVEIGSGVLVGANATILQGIRIGAGAIVGASACVVGEVAAGAIVKGVPAR